MTTNGKTFPVLARAFSRSRAKRSSSSATSPPRTTCFDIFSPPRGHSEVISHVDRLSSNETKMAPRQLSTYRELRDGLEPRRGQLEAARGQGQGEVGKPY